MEEPASFGFETRQVHAGQRPDPNTGARAVPIYQTTSYVFEDPESAAAYFNLQEYGNTYSRIMNPTVAVFEERMANLEGGCGAVAFASGIAAQAAALFTLLSARRSRRVVVGALRRDGQPVQAPAAQDVRGADVGRSRRSRRVEGGRPRQHEGVLRRDDRQPRRQRARHRGDRGHRARARAPADRRQHVRDAVSLPPDRMGRRHRRCTRRRSSSAVTARASAAWSSTRASSTGRTAAFRSIADPSPAYHGLQFHETFGTYGYLMKLRAETLRDLGAAMSPFNAFLFLQGLETLSLRMARHVENAAAVASYLDVARARLERDLPGPADEPLPAARRQVPAARRRRGVLVRLPRRPRRGTGLHSRRHAVVAPRERRRFEEPHHPSGQHDASSARTTTSCGRPVSARERSGSRSASNRSTI